MREDYTAALAPYVRSIPTRLHSTFRLDLLGVEGALQAIREPVRQAGAFFDETAALHLVNDLRSVQEQRPDGTLIRVSGPHVEPVQLQVVCYRLWRNLEPEDENITDSDLEAVGDVNQSLAAYYAESVSNAAKSSGTRERIIREWFENKLITEQGIRTQVILSPEASGGLANETIRLLQDAHLVRAENRRGVTWFELAHDRLVDPVRQNNHTWFQEHLSLLQRQAALWQTENRPASLLLSGQELELAETWAAQQPEEMTPSDTEFLSASQEARAEEERQSAEQLFRLEAAQKLAESETNRATEQEKAAQQLQKRFFISLALLGLAVLFAIIAWLNIGRANNLAAEAQEARDRAVEQGATAQAASTQAVEQRATAQAASTQAVQGQRRAESAEERAVAAQETAQAEQVRAEVQAQVAFSNELAAQSAASRDVYPQRSLILAVESMLLSAEVAGKASLTSTQALYNALENAAGRVFHGLKNEVWTVGMSADQHWLAASGPDETLFVWDLTVSAPEWQPFQLAGHTEPVTALRFLPGKSWLASAGRDGRVIVWDLSAGEPAAPLLNIEAHTQSIDTMEISADGHWLATGARDDRILLFDMTGTEPVQTAEFLHEGNVNALAFMDNNRLVTGSTDDTLRIWTLEPLSTNPTFILPVTGNIVTVAGYGRKNFVAAGLDDGTLFFWTIGENPDPEPIIRDKGHTRDIRTMAFSPDGQWLASGSTDRKIVLWDVSVGNPPEVGLFLRGHEGGVLDLLFTPDNRWLISGSTDFTARMWDMSKKDPGEEPIILRGHEGSIRDLALAPDARQLITGSTDHRVRVWDLNGPSRSTDPELLAGFENDIRALAFSPDGLWLASAGRQEEVFLWDLHGESAVTTPIVLSGHTDDLSSVAFSPDGKWLASAGGDRVVRLWDITNQQFAAPALNLGGHGGRITALAFTPDGSRLLSASRDSSVRVWQPDISAGLNQTVQVLTGHRSDVMSLVTDPNGRWAASGDAEGLVILWDLSQAPPTPISLDTGTAPINALAFSADNKWLAAAADDGALLVWSMVEGTPQNFQRIEKHTGSVTAVGFSYDQRWLASAGKEGKIYLFDLRRPDFAQNPIQMSYGGNREILGLTFTADRRWLAAAIGDGTVRMWDLSAADPSSTAIMLHSGNYVWVVASSLDGRYLASGGRDTLVRLWHLQLDDLTTRACQTAGRDLTITEWRIQFGPQEPYRATCSQTIQSAPEQP
jgi:WD40 repeat protein